MISVGIAAILIAIAGLHSVGTVGVTGGPNHGEHPFTVTIIHIVVFAILARNWPALSRQLYWAGLIAALVLSVVALALTHNEDKRWRAFIRIPLALLYVGFLVLLFKRPS